jgi:hypothetical protein
MICNRCRKNNLGNCTFGYHKTEEQIQRENYSCFSERIFNINRRLNNPDDFDFEPYGKEVNYLQIKFYSDMMKAERDKRKIS